MIGVPQIFARGLVVRDVRVPVRVQRERGVIDASPEIDRLRGPDVRARYRTPGGDGQEDRGKDQKPEGEVGESPAVAVSGPGFAGELLVYKLAQ